MQSLTTTGTLVPCSLTSVVSSTPYTVCECVSVSVSVWECECVSVCVCVSVSVWECVCVCVWVSVWKEETSADYVVI